MERHSEPFWVRLPYTLTGSGTVNQVGKLAKQLGGKRVLVVTDPGVVQAGLLSYVEQSLEKEGVNFGVFDRCEPNCPIGVVQSCARYAKEGEYDLMIGLGGGSTMDVTKLASIAAVSENPELENIGLSGPPRRGLPKILIPTTAGTGSEISPSAVLVDTDNVKKSVSSEYNLSNIAIVDPLMTQHLPPEITAQTGMDALTHAFEGYLCSTPNIVADTLAEMAIKLISENLRSAYRDGAHDLEARYAMAIAATYAMASPFASGFSVYHAIGHSLQIEAKTTHGISLYLVMPPVMEFNLMTTSDRFARIAELMGEEIEGLSQREAARKSIDAVKKLGADIGLPQRLRDIGVKKDQLPRFVDILFTTNGSRVKANVPPISREDATRMYEAIW